MVNGEYPIYMSNKLTEADCSYAMRSGDFADSVKKSAPAVAVVLTQSWCPQWRFMNSFLADAEKAAGDQVAVHHLEYDREPFFEDFMTFKEDVFGNRDVPYVRYYRDGVLVAESNYISRQGFLSKLGIK